ncbi:uncharacterized protein [Montipora foliosa]|uniref:uncharacterized protein isoform X1 n=2 Tax=Montipora foliosa TaxID=591990 RepID=UPI0035F14E47
MNGMRLCLPLLLCVIVAAQHLKADAKHRLDLRLRLGKALFRRAREINETAQVNDDKREDSEGDLTEQERERAQEVDTAEDIFVGSGNHVFESQGKSDASDSKGEETSGDEDIASDDEAEDDRSSTSGDGDEGDEDDDDEKENSDDDDDNSIQRNSETTEEASSEGVDSSGSALMENESASRRSHDTSGSGSGNEDQADSESQESDQSESVESSTEGSSQDTSSGSGKDTNVFKKSEIEATSSGESEDDDESGSAEIIRKGIESLSKLLKPVASGYEFELFSGKAPKNDKESEAEGESEKGERNDSEVTHVKQCKRVCEDPMTYNECAVPRCDYKMGTIKDLCIFLCKHQTPVCRQECE